MDWTEEFASQFPASLLTAGGSSSAAPSQISIPPAPPIRADKPANPTFPIKLDGEYIALVQPNAEDTDRKHFVGVVPWHDHLKLGCSLSFTEVSGGIPRLNFAVPKDEFARGKAIKLSFSLPKSFALDQIALAGLCVVKYAPVTKSPHKSPVKTSRSAGKSVAKPELECVPLPDLEYVPADGYKVNAEKPDAVRIGMLIAHRWDRCSFQRGWCECLVAKACTSGKFSGQFECVYQNFNPSTYYHKLSLEDYTTVWTVVEKFGIPVQSTARPDAIPKAAAEGARSSRVRKQSDLANVSVPPENHHTKAPKKRTVR